jgi:predicted ArsR family transcriptional regulator
MKTTRQLLCEHLQLKRTATASELARALRVTPANIRHHLSALLSEGVVEKVGQQPAIGRGRPVQIFGLVEQTSRNNLVLLVKALLSEVGAERSALELETFFKRLAAHLIGSERPPARTLAQRYVQAIQHLNTMGYLARWEAHAKAPRVIFSHCPYAAVIEDHPELCLLDQYLLEALLSEDARQITKLEKTAHGDRQCIFLIGG